MSRGPRIVVENMPYHIIIRGNARQVVFHENKDYEIYLRLLKGYKEKFGFKLYHYVLMANHVHLILEVNQKGHLQKIIQGLNLSYSQRYRLKYKTSGYLWQGRFKSMLIERNVYLLECGRYIERNPLRAGLVKDITLYPWSSYKFYAYGEEDGLTDLDSLYSAMGSISEERQRNYRDYVLSARDSESKGLLAFQDGGVLGSDDFRHQMEEILGRLKKWKRGRPRKYP